MTGRAPGERSPGSGARGAAGQPRAQVTRRRVLEAGLSLVAVTVAGSALGSCTTSPEGGTGVPGPAQPTTAGDLVLHETWMGDDGSTWPGDWDTFGETVEIRSNAGRAVTGTASYDSAGAERPGIVDGEILVAWRWASEIDERYLRLHCRHEGDGGYYLAVGAREIVLNRLEPDDESTELESASEDFLVGTTYWTRFRWSGPTLQARIWPDGEREPTTWDVEANDPTYTTAGTIIVEVRTGDDGGEQVAVFNDLWLWGYPQQLLQPDVYFVGDFETGDLAQWSTTHISGGSTEPAIVADPVRPGGSNYAALFAVAAPQFRCELEVDRSSPLVGKQGSDVYYGWSILFQSPFPVGLWQVTGQWHSNVNNQDEWDDTSPPLSVTVASTLPGLDPAHWYIDGGRKNPMNYPLWWYDLGPMVFDRWIDVVVRTVLSTRPEECLLQAWLDGRKVVDAVPPAPLLYPTTNPDRYNYLKVGYYRDDEIEDEGRVLFDDVRIGRTYRSVDPRI